MPGGPKPSLRDGHEITRIVPMDGLGTQRAMRSGALGDLEFVHPLHELIDPMISGG